MLVVGVRSTQFFGLRFVMDGGGTPYPRFVDSSQLQAERIERHREAQRAAAEATPSPAVTEPVPTAAPIAASTTVRSRPDRETGAGPAAGRHRTGPISVDQGATEITRKCRFLPIGRPPG